jgi:hypothetical protein
LGKKSVLSSLTEIYDWQRYFSPRKQNNVGMSSFMATIWFGMYFIAAVLIPSHRDTGDRCTSLVLACFRKCKSMFSVGRVVGCREEEEGVK